LPICHAAKASVIVSAASSRTCPLRSAFPVSTHGASLSPIRIPR
jgi:hypothetical protein